MTITQRIKAALNNINHGTGYSGVVKKDGKRFTHRIDRFSNGNEKSETFSGYLLEIRDLNNREILEDTLVGKLHYYDCLEDAIHGEYGQYSEDTNGQSGCIEREFVYALALLFIGVIIGSIITLKILVNMGVIK